VARSRRSRPAGPGLRERLKRTASLLLSREVTVLNNAIAFNFLLCLFPLLLVLVAGAQRLSPGSGGANALRQLLGELIPIGGDTFATSLRQMTRVAPGFQLFSLALIVWGSSGIFIPVERVLNHVWGARAERSFWKSRLLAFLLTASCAALALLSLSLTLYGRSLGGRVHPRDVVFCRGAHDEHPGLPRGKCPERHARNPPSRKVRSITSSMDWLASACTYASR